MNELSITEKTLIDGYNNDFYFKTGKRIEFKVLSKWETLCRLGDKIPTDELFSLILEGGGWTKEEVFENTKRVNTVLKRRIVFFILHCNNVSYKEIGRLSGNDHTTAIDAIKKFEIEIETNYPMQKLLREIMIFVTGTVNSVTIN